METIFVDNNNRVKRPLKILDGFIKIDVGFVITYKKIRYRVTNYRLDIGTELLTIHCQKIKE